MLREEFIDLGYDTNRVFRHAGRRGIPHLQVYGTDRAASSKGQFSDSADTWNLTAGEVEVEVAQTQLKLRQGFALSQVIPELLLPTSHRHCDTQLQ